jgi:mRNA interferase MazF
MNARVQYVAKQGDLIWVDFNPAKGREIQKRRPALVISSDAYNKTTGFVVVCPITSTIRVNPTNHTLMNTKTTGQVITSQIRSLDVSGNAARRIEFIEQLPTEQFGIIAQLVNHVFDFDPIFSWTP